MKSNRIVSSSYDAWKEPLSDYLLISQRIFFSSLFCFYSHHILSFMSYSYIYIFGCVFLYVDIFHVFKMWYNTLRTHMHSSRTNVVTLMAAKCVNKCTQIFPAQDQCHPFCSSMFHLVCVQVAHTFIYIYVYWIKVLQFRKCLRWYLYLDKWRARE